MSQLTFVKQGTYECGHGVTPICYHYGWYSTVLQRDHPRLFTNLHCGTVARWISKKGKKWSKKMIENVAHCSVLTRTGHVGILMLYPEIVQEITSKLKGLRLSGVPVDVLVV